ncbi:LuxR C-terminal-related transcriptional regulator [Variovorax sp. NFACC27]|uniref:LuxR C-terminal-related transcriptional regulator n=1 Tax=unclassified Variovorax TaxID=663243 RepID=UPI000898D977|nr:LuxR family transcriptional regulator, maltose regulon positive regulatory protein [Variovorax sp. NFACC28]SEG93700.1 LuxR family transcriptional regulator, maltose regulon positive regulatory protein [Variovorax sp. NFACC29]SFD60338.1 LuxR family transcriptional regulator, maltose regulon positive regulatory protein [Variovorax sp. NFACC26]SFG89892.1 LuxR family transcriptional regulator, maltose regulon positive regulatory protein [Variovorax sp. NFACC27]
MQSPTPRILETKLNPPAFVATQVQRTAIGEEVASAAVKLVLVRAPAGFGKTTAMAQIRERMEARGIATAWLTLDRADNDVSRFLDCLAEAVQRLGVEDPRGSNSSPFDAVAALAAHESPFTLFLDDFERVQEPAVLGLMREIVEHLPRRGQIVIGSRSLPDLGLGRLRARGQLTEIDTDRLRFSLEETSAFFGLRQALPPEMLSLLHRKTEGWVAAIWLASMALERHGTGTATGFVERFSGSDRAVADYLAEDVLAHQPKEIRDFLLRTSILRQLDASVCQALCPRMDCAAILEQLAASNLFLTPVSGDGDAWRYHSLFADFLRAQLAREMPGEPARLHLAASGWYESHGRPVPAIDHAIEGGDHPHALTLLDSHAAQFLEEGRMRMLARWFSAIPEHQLREHPFLQPISLWATCFTHGPWDAMRQLEKSGCLDSPIAEVRASAHTLVPLLLAMQDRHDEAYEAGRQSLARLPTGLAFADSVLLNAMAHILAVRGDQHEARRLLDAARRQQGNSAFNRMYTESLAGLFDLHEGRLRQATARLRMAVDSTHAVSYNHSHGNAWAGVLYAGAVYETNQLAQAERLLNVYLPLARDVGLPDHMILSHVMRSRLAFHAGDIDAAFQALTELEYLGHARQLPRVVAGAKLERSRMLLLQGNGPASHDELLRADDPALWQRELRQRLPAHDLDYLALAKARWEIAFGDARAALGVLDAELHAALAVARNRRALKLRVLRALALQRAGDLSAAVEQFGEVLQAASQEGFMRLILDEGPAVGPLVHRCAAAMQEGATIDPILADHLQRLLQAVGPMTGAAEAEAPAGGDAMKEPLTRKEIRVLQLLAEGYSNNAMAEKLFVSDSTVRTHLRNINMKLDAKSRTQAVAIARRLGVIR